MGASRAVAAVAANDDAAAAATSDAVIATATTTTIHASLMTQHPSSLPQRACAPANCCRAAARRAVGG